MIQPSPRPSPHFLDRFRTGAGRRASGLALALLIEGLLLLLLLTLGIRTPPEKAEDRFTTISTFDAAELPEEEVREPSPAQAARPAEARPEPPAPPTEKVQPPQPHQPVEPLAAPAPVPIIPMPFDLRSSASPRPRPPAPASRGVYGPVDNRGPGESGDSERVGTAPNGEPLYAASWYRKPRDGDLRDYLSTAHGPGWGMIACRTASEYRVEDCVALDEYPQGSQINRALLAAAWEFRVRPPRLGGRSLVGSWVRIRIDYDLAPR